MFIRESAAGTTTEERQSHKTYGMMYGMTPGMKRTTIYLPDELKARLEAAAKRRGVTEADIIRLAVDKELTRGLQGAGIITDPLPEGVSGRTLEEHMKGFGEM